MDLFLQAILSWVLRALSVKETDVKPFKILPVSPLEVKEMTCAFPSSPSCQVRIFNDYSTNTMYMSTEVKYSESVDENAEVVYYMVLFVLHSKPTGKLTLREEVEASKKAAELSEISKKSLVRFLVI